MTRRNPKSFGISHLSADRNYVEYLADPASQLAMACKGLLETSKIKSERQNIKPVEKNTIIKHIICHSVVVLGFFGLLYLFQASLGVWIICILCTFVYGLIVW
jgi:protein-S-isoprenylcysteine O-methyltransferase Ste14